MYIAVFSYIDAKEQKRVTKKFITIENFESILSMMTYYWGCSNKSTLNFRVTIKYIADKEEAKKYLEKK